VNKYFIAVVLLLGLMQGKTEALEKDIFIIIKEFGVISAKYKKCSDTKDDKKRLACFDILTKYMGEREKKWENLVKSDKLSDDSKKEAKKQFKNMVKELDKFLGLKK
jgi:hypothetical protein